MVFIRKAIFLFTFAAGMMSYAQPQLEIYPDEMEFEDVFNRLENVYFINEGDTQLRIDSIVYKNDLYSIRFSNQYLLPFYIQPMDTVMMDCILAGYYYVPSTDTLDTMYVYSSSINGTEGIKIKIDYYDNNYGQGEINGFITDSVSSPIANSKVYFFYDGNYIIHSATSDNNGYYSAVLPPGDYLVAAQKDSYYVTFFDQQFDPLNGEFINLENDSTKSVNIILPKEETTSNSVSGMIYDSLSGTPLNKGLVIVRSGNHTPTKNASKLYSSVVPNGIYTTFISRGSYNVNNIIEPGYYYIQSFSDYFVPTYYSKSALPQIFWQGADSVYIGSAVNDRNIFMPRDSSLGGGNALGSVSVNLRSVDSVSDVIVYAHPLNNESSVFNYSFVSQNGNFKIPFLPYGNYKLVAQKIGYYDGYSSEFIIDSLNTSIGNLDITLVPLSVDEEPAIPENHILLYNYPNPFNPETTIGFSIPFSSDVEIKIINMLGEDVRTLIKEYLSAGKYGVVFNAGNLSSGTYFVILKTNMGTTAQKIILLK